MSRVSIFIPDDDLEGTMRALYLRRAPFELAILASLLILRSGLGYFRPLWVGKRRLYFCVPPAFFLTSGT